MAKKILVLAGDFVEDYDSSEKGAFQPEISERNKSVRKHKQN